MAIVPPNSLDPVVEAAFKNFKDIIRPIDDRMFKQTTLEDVRTAARIISRDQSQRNCLRNLGRLQPFFDVLQNLSAPIDTLCQGTPYLCYIWAPIKLILQIANEYGSSFEKIVDAYTQIAQHLPRIDRFSDAFSDVPDFQSILADIYNDILEFHGAAYQFVRRGGWKALFDASWRNFGSRFNTILRRLERGRELLDKEAASFEILESKNFRQKILDDLEKVERDRMEWQMRDSLVWLDLKGQDREQEELIERRTTNREPGTCTWILCHPKVMAWLDDNDSNPLLWINGKPGSGKTTLVTYFIEEAAFPPDAITLYCLCSYGFGKSETNACSLMIRSLIAQIVRCKKSLLPFVYDNYVKIGVTASLPKTKILLRTLLGAIEKTFLVIDGVDECNSEDQKQIISELSILSSPNEDDNATRILICSRETPDIARKLGKVPKLSLTDVKEKVERDIMAFTMTSLAELNDQFDDVVIKSAGQEIVRKANGMFLWVQLVIASLINQGSVQDLLRTIDRLPAGLRGMYQSILANIESSNDDSLRDRAHFVLSLLATSCRPLKAWEVCDLIVFHEGAGPLDTHNKLLSSVLNICKPLIEELDGETMHIVHFSAREFLFGTFSGPYLDHTNVHCHISTACVKYLLSTGTIFDEPSSGQTVADIANGFHDLFPYVYEFWTRHLNQALAHQQRSANMVSQKLLRWLELLTAYIDPLSKEVAGNSTSSPALHPTSQTDESSMVLPTTIKNYLNYRIEFIEKQHRVFTNTEASAQVASSDPTILTEIYNNFLVKFEELLLGDSVDDGRVPVSRQTLERFRSRHGNSAYLCHWSGCVWSSSGFRNEAERSKHEESHRKRFRCPRPDCDEAIGGFASKQALRRHKDKYHVTASEIELPPFRPPKQNPSPSGGYNIASVPSSPSLGVWDFYQPENLPSAFWLFRTEKSLQLLDDGVPIESLDEVIRQRWLKLCEEDRQSWESYHEELEAYQIQKEKLDRISRSDI